MSKMVRIFWKVFLYGLAAFILFLVLINLVADILYAYLDPRISL